MDDLIIKFIFAIIFVGIVIVIIYYGMTDKEAQTKRLYAYIFSIVIPMIGIVLYLKEDMVNAGMNAWWYISIFLGGVVAVSVVITLYNYMPTGSSSLLFVNLIIYLFLFLVLFVGLAIVYNIGQDYFSKQTGMFAIWIQILFYVPCMINNLILYLFQEFSIIPNMVFVLFVLEIILILIYIYGPDVANMIVTDGGAVLLSDYRQLNTFNTIADAKQFQIQLPANGIIDDDKTSCVDINGTDISHVSLVDHAVDSAQPSDIQRKPKLKGVSDPIYESKGTTDPSNNLCKFNPYLVVDPYNAIKCGLVDINDIKNPEIYNQPDLYASISKQAKDEYNEKLRIQSQPIYNKNYSITFWAYLNPKPEIFKTNHEYNILNYSSLATDYQGNGGNPKITYLNDTYNIYFSNNEACQSNDKYTSNCMYKIQLKSQKWNYFVFNYSSGHADLFVNGILEKTYKFSDNAPVYSNSDQINIGEKNGAYGYICNVMYYPKPLMKSQIANYYNILSVRNPPLIKS
jgi:hypothetical protein